jgi:predicted permease
VNLLRRLRVWRLRLRSLLRRDALDTDLHKELLFHFEQLVAENVDRGLTLEDAHREAHRALGNVAVLEEYCRDQRRVTWAHDLRQDVAYALRMLRKQPGLTIVAITSLALGIGANTAVLGAFDALFVRGLPVAQADRLVAIQSVPLDNPAQLSGLSLQDYAAIRARSRSFELVDASIRFSSDLASDTSGTPPERIVGQLVTPGWLSFLGIPPHLGQVFVEADRHAPAPAPAIVISHDLWLRRFGGDHGVVNRQVRIQGSPKTIIGVMPAEFRYQQSEVDYWAPLAVGPQPDPGGRLFGVRARLKPDVSLAQAQAELRILAATLERERPGQDKGWGLHVQSLNERLFGWTRRPLLMFEAAVALVLLIACANVAALLLSRASMRQHEMALRAALGAGRGRLIRQVLVESLLLAIGGGVVGLFVAIAGQQALVAMTGPPGAPPLTGIALSFRTLGLLALLSLAAGLACGIVPALRSSRPNPIGALNERGPAIGAPRRQTLARGLLVSAQLALALILLIGSGLLLNSLVRLVQRDLSFDPEGLVRVDYGIPTGDYLKRIGTYKGFPYFEITTPPSQMLQRVLDRLRLVPGAASVAGISAPPVDSFILTTPEVLLSPPVHAPVSAAYFLVTPHLFSTLGTSLLHGRDFTDQDTAGTPWTAVVNETCARVFWPGENAIGKRLTVDTVPEEHAREVIGVVRDIPTRHAEPPQPVIYASYLQQPTRYRGPWAGLFGTMIFMMRGTGDPQTLIPAARLALAEIDPERPIAPVSTEESHLSNGVGQFRNSVLLVSVLAAVAMLLAATGTYGVMAYSVSQHTREIGIRRALGAGRREIVGFVGRRALTYVGLGLAAGLIGARLLTRLIGSQLWGITPTDPATFVTVSVVLVAVAAIACVIPARRALAVDPTIALRSE